MNVYRLPFRSFRTKYAGYRAQERMLGRQKKRDLCFYFISGRFRNFSLGLGSAILLWKLIKSLNVAYLLMEHRRFMFLGLNFR